MNYLVTDGLYGTEPDIKVYRTEALDQRAEFACEIIRQHALIAAEDGGEDAAGRQKQRTQTVDEIVTKACDIAQAAFEQFQQRGWRIQLPDLAELHAEHKRKKAEEKALEKAARSTAMA